MSSGGVATASGSGSRSQSKRERSCSSKSATSPSSTRERAGSATTAAAMPGKRRVWSWPLRLTRRTGAPSQDLSEGVSLICSFPTPRDSLRHRATSSGSNTRCSAPSR